MPIYKVRCSRFEKWCVRFIVFRKDRMRWVLKTAIQVTPFLNTLTIFDRVGMRDMARVNNIKVIRSK